MICRHFDNDLECHWKMSENVKYDTLDSLKMYVNQMASAGCI